GGGASIDVVDVEADLQSLVHRPGAVDGQQGEELLDRQGMLTAHSLNRGDQQLGMGRHRKPDHAGNIGGLLAHGDGPGEARVGVDDGAAKQGGLFGAADIGSQFGELLESEVVDFVIDHHSLLGGADGSVVEGLGSDDVHHSHVEVGGLLEVDRGVAGAYAERRL